MTILYIHQYFNIPTGIGSTRSYDLGIRFKQKGFNVVFITSSAFLNSNQKKRWCYIEHDGLQIYSLKSNYNNNMKFRQRIAEFIKFLFFSTLKSLTIKFDLIIATSTPITVGVPALINKMFRGKPFIFEVRDVWPDVPIGMNIIRNKFLILLLSIYEKVIYHSAIQIVALSIDMRKCIADKGISFSKIHVIPNISDLRKFEKSDNSNLVEKYGIHKKDKNIVLYAGTIGIVNGLQYMVDLASWSKKYGCSDVIYIILGDGIEKNKVKLYAEENKVLNEILFLLDPIAKQDLYLMYNECTVACSFVINNKVLWANSANKYFDALAAGKPIVVNHGGWQADEIIEKQIGCVLDTNPKIGAQDLINYLSNNEKIKQHSKNAKQVAINKYSLNLLSDKYIKLIQSV